MNRTDARQADRKKLVLLGDSIVYGWGVMRRERYANVLQDLCDVHPQLCRWHIIAEGVPGDTVLQGVARFGLDVLPHQPDAVLIAFGLNDGALSRTAIDVQRERLYLARTQPWWRAWFWLRKASRILRRWPKLRPGQRQVVRQTDMPRVRPQLFEAGLRTLIKGTRQLGAEPILLAMLPTYCAESAQQNSYSAFATSIHKVADTTSVPVIQLDQATWHPSYYQPDGVHLTAEGHSRLATAIHQQLEQVLP